MLPLIETEEALVELMTRPSPEVEAAVRVKLPLGAQMS